MLPPPPILVEGEEEYEVEAILRHKGKGTRRRYLVMWKGYPLTEASWEPESHLQNAPQILEDYLCRVAEADGTSNPLGSEEHTCAGSLRLMADDHGTEEASELSVGASEGLPEPLGESSGWVQLVWGLK